MPYDDSKFTLNDWIKNKEYSYTYSTNMFYEKTPNNEIKRLNTKIFPKSFLRKIMENSPNWIKK